MASAVFTAFGSWPFADPKRRAKRLLLLEESGQRELLGFEFIGDRYEAVLGRDQRAVQFVIGELELGDPPLIGGLHLLEVVFLGRDDAVLEHHVDGRKGDPAQTQEACACQDRLRQRTERTEVNPALAANVDLALWKPHAEGFPDAFAARFVHMPVPRRPRRL